MLRCQWWILQQLSFEVFNPQWDMTWYLSIQGRITLPSSQFHNMQRWAELQDLHATNMRSMPEGILSTDSSRTWERKIEQEKGNHLCSSREWTLWILGLCSYFQLSIETKVGLSFGCQSGYGMYQRNLWVYSLCHVPSEPPTPFLWQCPQSCLTNLLANASRWT